MKLRKNIQKIGALAGSGLMATLSVASPVAAELGDLPQPFVQDGEFSGNLVVGEEASTEDVLGAIDIASSFQAEATSPVEVSSGGSVTVEGGEDIEQAVGQNLTTGSGALDDSDLEGFQDDAVDVDGTDYDFVEELELKEDSAAVVTSAISGISDEDDNYGLDPYLEMQQGGLTYSLNFEEDPIPGSEVSSDEEASMDFLGRELEVTSVQDEAVTVRSSNELTLELGDTVTVNDREITLANVGDNSILLEVDGERGAVDTTQGADQDFDGGFEVEYESSFYDENGDDDFATIRAGSAITETYDDGDALEIFGGTDDEDDASWTWNVTTNEQDGTTNEQDGNYELERLGIDLNQDYEEVDVSDADERAALSMGTPLDLPNNYAEVTFQGFEDAAMEDRSEVNVDFTEETFDSVENQAAVPGNLATDREYVRLEADNDDFKLAGSGESQGSAEQVFITHNGTSTDDDYHVFYDDGEDDYYAGELKRFNSSEYSGSGGFAGANGSVEVYYEADDQAVPVVLEDADTSSAGLSEGGAPLYFDWDQAGFDAEVEHFAFNLNVSSEGLTHLGEREGETDGADFRYMYNNSQVQSMQVLGPTDDEERRTAYGVTFSDAESMVESDDFTFEAPAQGQVARTLITTTASTVSEGDESDSGAVEVNRIPVGLGVLDSDVVSNGEITAEGPHIVVGGPYANTAASALLGNPSSSEIESMFESGRATIRMFDDSNALLVAGYDPQDTVRASRVVADYQDYTEELTGSEVELVFDGSEDIQFQAPSMDEMENTNGSDSSQ